MKATEMPKVNIAARTGVSSGPEPSAKKSIAASGKILSLATLCRIRGAPTRHPRAEDSVAAKMPTYTRGA